MKTIKFTQAELDVLTDALDDGNSHTPIYQSAFNKILSAYNSK